jgi:hypothetical protein
MTPPVTGIAGLEHAARERRIGGNEGGIVGDEQAVESGAGFVLLDRHPSWVPASPRPRMTLWLPALRLKAVGMLARLTATHW